MQSIFNFNFHIKRKYQSGGAGYVLSNEALKRFGSALNSTFETCPNTGVEDRDVGQCLRKVNVDMGHSIDGNKERFHVDSMQHHFKNINLGWLKGYSQNVYLQGYNCCSDTSISFHRQTLAEMRLMKKLWSQDLTFKKFYDNFVVLGKNLTEFVAVSRL